MTERSNRRKSLLSIVVLACVLLPTIAGAEGYVNLVGLPGIDSGSPDMQTFVNSALRIAIIAAALIAVIKLILAGAQYVLSGVITDKENAKRDIRSALVGLLIVLAAVTILVTINPKLATLPSLSALPELQAPPPANTVSPSQCPAGKLFYSCGGQQGCYVSGGENPCSTTPADVPTDEKPARFNCTRMDSSDGSSWYDCDDAKNACAQRGGTSSGDGVRGYISCTY